MSDDVKLSTAAQRMIAAVPALPPAKRDNLRANAQRHLELGGRAAVDARAILEALEASTSTGRLYDDVRRAFDERPPSARQAALLQALVDNPARRPRGWPS